MSVLHADSTEALSDSNHSASKCPDWVSSRIFCLGGGGGGGKIVCKDHCV